MGTQLIPELLDEAHERAGQHLQNFIDSIGDGKLLYEQFEKARNILYMHIYWEESTLFRAVENERNSPRIHGMEVEHGGIWRLLGRIDEYVQSSEDELAIDRLEGLIRVLVTHRQAEVRTIYREFENMDLRSQAELVVSEMERASPPKGWVCSILRSQQ